MAYNLESLQQSLQTILHPVPCHQRLIQLDSEQKLLLESLLEKAYFLKQVFENPTWLASDGVEGLERRICDAAHDAEDAMESHYRDPILFRLNSDRLQLSQSKKVNFLKQLFQSCLPLIGEDEEVVESRLIDQLPLSLPNLGKLILEFDLIKEEIMEIMDSSASPSLPVSSTTDLNPKNIIVGIDRDLFRLKDRLTGHQRNLETITIVGMGGIGKTTLAQHPYNDYLIVYHFDIRAWITISQQYDRSRILSDLAKCVLGQPTTDEESLKVHKTLFGKRYLLVFDDMWTSEAWDDLKLLLPNNKNGSRVVVTTREQSVATYVGSFHHQMNFLNKVDSWKLLHARVFGEEKCPRRLEKVGQEIVQEMVRDSKGLPLAIHVVGGILSKLPRTQKTWKEIAREVTLAMVNTGTQFTNILSLSYNHLPCHLKPCFLYMSAFPEDYEIRVSKLTRLWVAEGFLRPIPCQSLEDTAKVYLKALTDRNLILAHRHQTKRVVKSYIMHDLVRDLCIRKAHEQNFFHPNVGKVQIHQPSQALRRVCVNDGIVISMESAMRIRIRTILTFSGIPMRHWTWEFPLLRVLDIVRQNLDEFPREILKIITLRYLALSFKSMCPLEISMLHNLQSIRFDRSWLANPWMASEVYNILMIPQLRHLKFKGLYPEFSLLPGQDFPLQENLQTLSKVKVNKFLQKLVEKTPNLKKLGIDAEDMTFSCAVDLICLSNLETLKISFPLRLHNRDILLSSVTFPISLNKVTLDGCSIREDHMNIMAELPNLQVLKLVWCSFEGQTWEPHEGGFERLKYLLLRRVALANWIADETHYPVLEHLIIQNCFQLKEIPAALGEIPTLERIELKGMCSASAVKSAREIQEEQLDQGNEILQVHTTELIILY